jgi:hypothetical protein
MHTKQILALLMFCMILLAAGCGGSSKTATQGESGAAKDTGTVKGLVDPQTLLTKAEAETLLGQPVKEPELKDTKNPMGQKLVFFSAVSDKALTFIQISLVQNEGMSKTLRDQKYDVKQLYTDTKKGLNDTKDVAGIGDEAFWGTNGLHILKGSFYINISVGNTSKAENLELAKKVAEKAMPRL